jgi:hypothetical protein
VNDTFGALCALLLLWLFVGVFPGYLLGTEDAFDGNNEAWGCTRWENKPDGDCTQWTRTEGKQ